MRTREPRSISGAGAEVRRRRLEAEPSSQSEVRIPTADQWEDGGHWQESNLGLASLSRVQCQCWVGAVVRDNNTTSSTTPGNQRKISKSWFGDTQPVRCIWLIPIIESSFNDVYCEYIVKSAKLRGLFLCSSRLGARQFPHFWKLLFIKLSKVWSSGNNILRFQIEIKRRARCRKTWNWHSFS